MTTLLEATTLGEYVEALDTMRVSDTWVVAKTLRQRLANSHRGDPLRSLTKRDKAAQGFRNQVVGRIAERVFWNRHLQPLEEDGFEVIDLHEAGENRDYVVRRDGYELPINVKTASTLFREAQKMVGLAPEDCIPISAYKAIGSCERVPELVYVDLVDFTLREKVDTFTDNLTGPQEILWELLAWYGGPGCRRAEDEFVAALFDTHARRLTAFVPRAATYRVISAQRVLAVMRDTPRRCPGLGVRAAGLGTFVAEVNIHVSVATETVPWDEVASIMQKSGIERVLKAILNSESREVPEPTI